MKWKSLLSKSISTVCGLGYMPFAQGTFGSIPGLFLGLAVNYFFHHVYQVEEINFIIISTLIGLTICAKAYIGILYTEKTWSHDDKRIVVDELAGQYFASVYLPLTLFYGLMSFSLFRFFDIVKPWPISWIDEEWNHSFATLADDLLAGFFAFLCLYAWKISGLCLCCLQL